MNEDELIKLGMFVNELDRLHQEYGFWLHNAEVCTPTQADPIAILVVGGVGYTVQLHK